MEQSCGFKQIYHSYRTRFVESRSDPRILVVFSIIALVAIVYLQVVLVESSCNEGATAAWASSWIGGRIS